MKQTEHPNEQAALPRKVRAAISDYSMLNSGESVTVALSGGADSTALLLALSELDFAVRAAHINHGLRGAESDFDEKFCAELCKSMNIDFCSFSVDVRSFAKKNGLSLEEAARTLRYDKLLGFAGGTALATAHTLNDNAETVLMNLARGSALRGLCGIPAKRENIIRPLIYCTRADVEEYLAVKHRDFVTDSTNLTDDYSRNRIRHKIIPELTGINPGFFKTALNEKKVFEAENDFIAQAVDAAFESCFDGSRLAGLNKFHRAVRCRCIAELLCRNGLAYSFERLNDIDAIVSGGGKITVGIGKFIVSDGESLWIEGAAEPFCDNKIIFLTDEGMLWNGRKYKSEIVNSADDYKINKKFANAIIDYDKIKGQPFFRTRRRGDKIGLCGRNFTSSVKKLLNAKIPLCERDSLCFLADDDGVVFIEKIGIAQRVCADADTKRLLIIKICDSAANERTEAVPEERRRFF